MIVQPSIRAGYSRFPAAPANPDLARQLEMLLRTNAATATLSGALGSDVSGLRAARQAERIEDEPPTAKTGPVRRAASGEVHDHGHHEYHGAGGVELDDQGQAEAEPLRV